MLKDAHLYAAALGFSLVDNVRLGERAVELAKGCEPEDLDDGGTMLTWRDPSRAALSVLLDERGRVRSVLPFLDGARELSAKIVEVLPTDEAADRTMVVDVFGSDNKWALRTGTHAQDLHVNRERLAKDVQMRISATAFARKFVVRAANTPSAVQELGDGETKWIATGLTAARQGRGSFSPARALIRAQILNCEQRMNRVTRELFQRARVLCEGVKLDVVAAYDESSPRMIFRQGEVLEGSVALMSTVDIEHHDYTIPLMRGRQPIS